MKQIDIDAGWSVLQDVHDEGEYLKLYNDPDLTDIGPQISQWEPIEALRHLQLLFAQHPYWGRELRYFNEAPWWYRNIVKLNEVTDNKHYTLRFTNVDYYAKVWFNGKLVACHEGYSLPFECDVTPFVHQGDNTLIVKVWSPWDPSVRDNASQERTHLVERQLIKGTYEHSDGLIARDVNPVGIYGNVCLIEQEKSFLTSGARISTTLDGSTGKVTLRGQLIGPEAPLTLSITAPDGSSVRKEQYHVKGNFEISMTLDDVLPWWPWDQGEPNLYTLRLSIDGNENLCRKIGFRTVELVRTHDQTQFRINGLPFYVRGTSYFPDVYLSAMNKTRYERDIKAIKDAGFNLIRVHVHVENPEFYDLCDRAGIAIIQDSEYNWTQPKSEDWERRFIAIFRDTVAMLDRHPSIICWICLNEPGCDDMVQGTQSYAMTTSPGPQIYKAITEFDRTRPAIKGSFCSDDVYSGDSHNYCGSLEAPDRPYTDIDGTYEKLNTEFGFDAPGAAGNLESVGLPSRITQELTKLTPSLQYYQSRLTKYYIEHYRCQKNRPNWGYVQFMFIDLCPQSFYGLLDWKGTLKPAYNELKAINQPIGVFFEQTAHCIKSIKAVNDSNHILANVEVSWKIFDQDAGKKIENRTTITLGNGDVTDVSTLDITDNGHRWDAELSLQDSSGTVIAENTYADIFNHPQHPKGHPNRISHEYGIRLYSI
ncbi:hypothetical protein OZX72_08790 [Bifidobacterium sp. ESL0769]|uniref:glycoside hydrolase family 2 protein n=1 Tax=Bifidobacterium sp. ESL0769 TaxID=2983229 RepID=UPI0023F73A2D|nr:sugar-binding domain-containing protein [Bifidobacterium sp. ESL0769]WEV67312.1 hypothetical protein OZX72_08790 [Bifidobacterium sp. ESL0769]